MSLVVQQDQLQAPETGRQSGAKTEKSKGREAYWPQLDGMRTVAFMLVFIHHLGGITSHDFPKMTVAQLLDLNNYVAWGWCGVDVFFVLSGFLISYLLISEKEKFGNISFKFFYARRALRIWPIYYTLLFFAAFIEPAMHWAKAQAGYAGYLLNHCLPLALFLGNYSLMNAVPLSEYAHHVDGALVYLLLPLWSLAVEEQFYLTWPFIINAVKKPASLFKIIASLCVFSAACRAVLWYASVHWFKLDFPTAIYYQAAPSHLEGLMMGACIAAGIFYHPQFFEKLKKFSPLLMLAMVFLSRHIGRRVPDLTCNLASNIYMFDLVAIVCGLFLVTALVSPIFKSFFGHPLMAKFGRLTYAMYLLHYFCIGLVDVVLRESPALTFGFPNWVVRFVLSLSLTFSLSWLSWHLVEKSFLAKRKYFTRA